MTKTLTKIKCNSTINTN